MIQAVSQVETFDECEQICRDSSKCVFFTYFGELNFLSHLCLLFTSCEEVDETCQDCVFGMPSCTVCSFEDTVNVTCMDCDNGWTQFGEFCYKLMDGDHNHYHSMKDCVNDCHLAGGELASIHSQEENNFIYTLLREQFAYIGNSSKKISYQSNLVGGFSN